jgi:hypothetical protein
MHGRMFADDRLSVYVSLRVYARGHILTNFLHLSLPL